MASRKVCNVSVDWQIEKNTNAERARHMLDTSLYSDCEFLVGNEDDKKIFRAHKIFLAMGSPVFEAMFFGGMAQANASLGMTQEIDAIEVLDLQPSAFKDLLEYVYTEQVELKSFDQACELCYAAKKYMIPNLVEKCSQFMWKDLIPQNVCRALEFANLYEDARLKERSLNLIRCRTKESFSNPEFEEISESTLLILVKDNDLDISEPELFQAVKRWANKECLRREIEPTSANMRLVLSNVISHIRFLTMTNEEFAEDPACSGVLQNEEILAILMNLSSRDKWQMPAHLSSCRDSRAPYRQDNQSDSTSAMLRSCEGPQASSSGRMYCYRRLEGETLIHNTGVLDCAVTLIVDRNVCIQGIVVSSQVGNNREETSTDSPFYTELLYCHLLDRDGTRLTYSHYSGRSAKRSALDIFFNRPVYVQRNREYRICVVLNRAGYYPLATASTWVMSQGVHFRFGANPSDPFPVGEGIRDGFIRGVIFSF